MGEAENARHESVGLDNKTQTMNVVVVVVVVIRFSIP